MMKIPTHILARTSNDPLEALIEIDEHVRPDIEAVATTSQIKAVEAYYSIIQHSCLVLGIPIGIQAETDMDATGAEESLYQTITFVESKKIDLMAARLRTIGPRLSLDQNWKDRIHSYLGKIRNIVNEAEVQKASRENILARLNDLAAEVDRERTSIQRFADVFIALCEAVSTGAKKLEPAIRLIERITGAVSAASKEQPRLELPAPDKLSLPAPKSENDSGPDDTSDA
jgi:hypothetical protein